MKHDIAVEQKEIRIEFMLRQKQRVEAIRPVIVGIFHKAHACSHTYASVDIPQLVGAVNDNLISLVPDDDDEVLDS